MSNYHPNTLSIPQGRLAVVFGNSSQGAELEGSRDRKVSWVSSTWSFGFRLVGCTKREGQTSRQFASRHCLTVLEKSEAGLGHIRVTGRGHALERLSNRGNEPCWSKDLRGFAI